jgi:hypothetical protein
MDTLEPEQRNILIQLGNAAVNSLFLKNLSKLNDASHSELSIINKDSDRSIETCLNIKYYRIF